MNEPKQHPDSADLTAYGLGQLPPDKVKSIEEHINECETCCEAVADQLADDTFVDLLQGARTAPMAETSDRDDSQRGFRFLL